MMSASSRAFPHCRTVGQDLQKCEETSSPLANKQQKLVEHGENIKFCWVSKLNFIFSTCSHLFCCLFTRGPDFRKVGENYIVILEMEQNAHFFSPHILWIWLILPNVSWLFETKWTPRDPYRLGHWNQKIQNR